MPFDIGLSLLLSRTRWTKLVREYIDGKALELFIEQSKLIINGESQEGSVTEMRFKPPIRSKDKHRWGGCLMGITFHGNWEMGPTLTLFSRTTYMGYIALLDMAIVHLIAKKITESFEDANAANIKFIWHITSLQFHHFKSMYYILSRDDLYQRLMKEKFQKSTSPVWWQVQRWFNNIKRDYNKHGLDMLTHCKYATYRRVKRRWLQHIGKLEGKRPPSLMVDDLDFSKVE